MKNISKPRATWKSINQYLSGAPAEQRAAMQKLRAMIHAVVPDIEECIDGDIPCFRFEGRALVHFGVARKHCSLFPGSRATIDKLAQELARFVVSKGTIRFQPDVPLPITLVRKILKDRIAENRAIDEDP